MKLSQQRPEKKVLMKKWLKEYMEKVKSMVEDVVVVVVVREVVDVVYKWNSNLYRYKSSVNLLCTIRKKKIVVLGHIFAQQLKWWWMTGFSNFLHIIWLMIWCAILLIIWIYMWLIKKWIDRSKLHLANFKCS
jgi:hypothetical protein